MQEFQNRKLAVYFTLIWQLFDIFPSDAFIWDNNKAILVQSVGWFVKHCLIAYAQAPKSK